MSGIRIGEVALSESYVEINNPRWQTNRQGVGAGRKGRRGRLAMASPSSGNHCNTCTHTPPNKRLWFAFARALSPLILSGSKLRWPSLQPRFETYFDMFGEETTENSVFKGIYHVASGEANGPLSFFSHNWLQRLISCIYTSLWSFLAMFLNPFFLSFHGTPFPSIGRPPRPDFNVSSY